ncbi:MAG: hypothetical protein IIC82_00780 [Chloroflexi bacterium]|nr:hypothetical protein [Chloroflexota bacterium]
MGETRSGDQNWNSDQKRRLKALHIDPVRNPPEKLREIAKHFRKPGASVFAITEGDGPLRVSKELARKIRKYVEEGKLDWVMDETSVQPGQGFDSEWRDWLLSNPAQFSQAVDAYLQELGRQIQSAEIHQGLRATIMSPRAPYGPTDQLFVESIFSRDLELADIRARFNSALKKGKIAEARKFSEKVGEGLVSRIAI